jgi:hypothetical protein
VFLIKAAKFEGSGSIAIILADGYLRAKRILAIPI